MIDFPDDDNDVPCFPDAEPVSEAERDAMIRHMRAEGETCAAIGLQFGLNKMQVVTICRTRPTGHG